MKTAIIVHSLTGNTLSVAQRLKDSLEKRGGDVHLENVVPSGGENKNEMDLTKISFPSRLDLEDFDNIVIAGPVRGFSMSPVLKAYFEKSSLKNRKVYMFVSALVWDANLLVLSVHFFFKNQKYGVRVTQ